MKYKQVIVVRADLRMGKGKLASQVAHAAVGASNLVRELKREWYDEWMEEGQRKVVVKVEGLEELLKVKEKADEAGIPNLLIEDAGLTQLPPKTITCLGIGPAPEELIDEVTGGLKLL